ncbi:effector-binding domain-containing protein [Zunongwangia mangrovi]|uniref:Effector-binding domain-containing protein n=1 Tax=Zunongwangia mangrovi TaxID=1334022 RepID=A0A1I1HHJ5_9FLAO|nr:GyrI-like domain-containing protein [Zunongwangia mangrovi]SFC23619.1 effector-binding domain-containing protein [Zunongwangia mangrovi]
MKIFKYLLFLILIVLIGGSIYVATKDGNYKFEESQVFNAPQEIVFKEVNNFENWEFWDPWNQDSENVITNYGDTVQGENASYLIESDEDGDIKIETIEAKPFTDITQKITLPHTFTNATSKMYWIFESLENGQTNVTWGMEGKQSFKEKLSFLLSEASLTEIMRPKLEKGLNMMQEVITNKMNEYSISVDGVVNHGGGYYMYTTTASKISQVSEKMQPMITQVSNFMEAQNIEKLGNPIVLYNEWNESNGSAIFSAGYFTPSEVITPLDADVLNGSMPNQKVLKTVLKGKYDNFEEAWNKAYQYIEENGLEVNQETKPFEVYLTNPEETPNPANWVTNIYIPVL